MQTTIASQQNHRKSSMLECPNLQKVMKFDNTHIHTQKKDVCCGLHLAKSNVMFSFHLQPLGDSWVLKKKKITTSSDKQRIQDDRTSHNEVKHQHDKK